MGSDGETSGKQGSKLGVIVAIATVLSALAGTYQVAKGEFLAACTSIGLTWCSQSGPTETGDRDGTTTPIVEPPKLMSGVAISKSTSSNDAVPAPRQRKTDDAVPAAEQRKTDDAEASIGEGKIADRLKTRPAKLRQRVRDALSHDNQDELSTMD